MSVPLHLVLDPPPVPRRRDRVARALAHVVGLGLTFTISLVGSGAAFHCARGPHVHHPCSPSEPPASCIARG